MLTDIINGGYDWDHKVGGGSAKYTKSSLVCLSYHINKFLLKKMFVIKVVTCVSKFNHGTDI